MRSKIAVSLEFPSTLQGVPFVEHFGGAAELQGQFICTVFGRGFFRTSSPTVISTGPHSLHHSKLFRERRQLWHCPLHMQQHQQYLLRENHTIIGYISYRATIRHWYWTLLRILSPSSPECASVNVSVTCLHCNTVSIIRDYLLCLPPSSHWVLCTASKASPFCSTSQAEKSEGGNVSKLTHKTLITRVCVNLWLSYISHAVSS